MTLGEATLQSFLYIYHVWQVHDTPGILAGKGSVFYGNFLVRKVILQNGN